MTEYESFLKRFDEINLIEDEDKQLDEFALLDQDIENWINKKYPELTYQYLPEEISDNLLDSEEDFIKELIKTYINIYDLINILDLNMEELIINYIESKNE